MARIIHHKNTSKKDIIIKKASTLFKIKGFTRASMRELAEVVGVEAPSLYNHIGSKSEILQTICFNVARAFKMQLDNVENSQTSITVKVEKILRFHITIMLNQFDEVFVANHDWKHLEDPYLSNFLNQRRQYEKRLVALVEEGIAKKEFININPYVAVLTLLSAVRGLEFWQRHKKNIDTKVLEDNMVTHLLNGLVK